MDFGKNLAATDKQFLEINGVNKILKQALVSLLEREPKNPIEFLACYFEWQCDQGNPLNRAFQLITEVHYDHVTFEGNLHEAYLTISQHKARKNVKGLTGDIFMDLMSLLSRCFSETLQKLLSDEMATAESDVVSYSKFRKSVLACLLLKDLLEWCNGIFPLLENNGNLPKTTCDMLVAHLEKVLNGSFDRKLDIAMTADSLLSTFIGEFESNTSFEQFRDNIVKTYFSAVFGK